MPKGIYKHSKRPDLAQRNKSIKMRTAVSVSKLGKIHSLEHTKKAVETRIKNGSYVAWNKGLSGVEFLKHFNIPPIPPKRFEENNNKWRGGITPENIRIRNSIDYKNWRKAVFERDDFICQECRQRGGYMEADHIKPFSLYPELRLVIDNGRTLCKDCHKKIGWSLFRENNPRKPILIACNP